MNCSQCEGIEREFNARNVEKEIDTYHAEGPIESTQLLIDAITDQDVHGLSLLDIGGGVGAIQHALLSAGASAATAVEASTAYADAAEHEARDLGWSEQVEVRHGDFVDMAESIPTHDIVTLDRVICCYHDMKSLVRLSADRASRLYGVVYPREVWWNKIAFRFMNLFQWISRSPFRTFIHSDSAIQDNLERAGLERIFHKKLFTWQVAVYAKTT
ncbi:MAG: methyltransferase [Anaerolineales bacterium]